MGDKSKIEWTDATWNAIRGCSRVSPGCENCYAERGAIRQINGLYSGLVKRDANGRPAWTGEVAFVPERLDDPIHWRRSRRIFVNSQSDLFHENLGAHHIAEIFAVMAIASQHSFQVLTKRAKRMQELVCDASFIAMVSEKVRARDFHGRAARMEWPLDNVWLGVSVEDAKRAEQRIPVLLDTPAAVRFLSMEPLLEAVDLTPWLEVWSTRKIGASELSWVIVGGESGPTARPFHVDWARSIVEACRKTGVACFVKQLGAVPVMEVREWYEVSQMPLLSERNDARALPGTVPLKLADWHGGEWDEWPACLADLKVREYPRGLEAPHGR